jgi:hypothetical protein
MTVDYVLVTAIIGALYLGIKQFAPDLPISDQVFQTVLLYLLAKIGVTVANKPAEAIRNFFAKG